MCASVFFAGASDGLRADESGRAAAAHLAPRARRALPVQPPLPAAELGEPRRRPAPPPHRLPRQQVHLRAFLAAQEGRRRRDLRSLNMDVKDHVESALFCQMVDMLERAKFHRVDD